ncbi:LLM class flavin-dependent oxidoreductase [Nocardioides sp. Kera G14]|uniref:LLM class flavin-dependent oxidoreductase n=1 Tax=Nocardioides sp. Kera G14 TaxID=2884264 RepID=UPI001D0FF922|nr:LLM class flavin-dependent oxidoreductase [Nocardioides sp. Kera G14]UDY23044.1 LLM class flavin-dependent oxidoreductase [Nocardioides sp. Kera G14]
MTTPDFDTTIPATASPEVEFVSQINWNTSREIDTAPPARGLDRAYVREYAKALEEGDFDYTLVPYFSSSPESFVLAAAIGAVTERIKPVVALRPNHTFPLVAAQKLATLDQLTQGRAVLHLISGGNDAEQRKQGDYEPKDRRYARTSEYIDLLRAAWTEKAPFSHDGEFYRFDDFGPGFPTYSGEPIPISIGGESDAAYDVGSSKADWFAFNSGASLAQTRLDFARVAQIASAAGRPTPRFWVTFRPVVASTPEKAWETAHDYAAKLSLSSQAFAKAFGLDLTKADPATITPEAVGQRRAREYAAASERVDRATWFGFTRATGGFGAASAGLVGTPETVAAAIVDYIDAGASVVSIKGYDTLNDVRTYGQEVLPLVRQELAHRKATGRRSDLQARHLGYADPAVVFAADRAAQSVAV